MLTGKAVYTAHRRTGEEKRPKNAGTALTGTHLEREQQTDPDTTDYSDSFTLMHTSHVILDTEAATD